MPIILKNAVVNSEELVKQQASLAESRSKYKWDNNTKQLILNEQPKKVVNEQPNRVVKEQPKKIVKEIKKIEEPPVVDRYKHIEEGGLHKLVNTKSDYLKDMLALED